LICVIDLHTHSTCSDGSEAPARVVEMAAEAGLRAVALTDHDNLAGLAEATRRADELGITFVPGCEVSCDFSPGGMHLLCYFVGDRPGAFADELARLREDRAGRNERLVGRLAELGITVDLDEVAEQAGSDVIGRPHFAAVMVRHGYAQDITDAFDRVLKKGAPGYVERSDVQVETAIRLANEAGGVAVLAHPHSLELGTTELDGLLAHLAEVGLGGIECHYGRYRKDERRELADLAEHHGLVATGGSDFHGSYKPDLAVGTGTGDLEVPDAALDELIARRGAPS
jgi:hypothetical protein